MQSNRHVEYRFSLLNGSLEIKQKVCVGVWE